MTLIRTLRYPRTITAIFGFLAISVIGVAQEWIRDTAFSPVLTNEVLVSEGLTLTPRVGGGYYVLGGGVGSVDGTLQVEVLVSEDFSSLVSADIKVPLPSANGVVTPTTVPVIDPSLIIPIVPVPPPDYSPVSTMGYVQLGDGSFLLRQRGGRSDGANGEYLRHVKADGTLVSLYLDSGNSVGFCSTSDGGALAWSTGVDNAPSHSRMLRFSPAGAVVMDCATAALLGESSVSTINAVAVRSDGSFFAKIRPTPTSLVEQIILAKGDGTVDSSFTPFSVDGSFTSPSFNLSRVNSLVALGDGGAAISIAEITGSGGARLVHLNVNGQRSQRYDSLPILWIQKIVSLADGALALELRNFPSARRPVISTTLYDTAQDTHSAVIVVDASGRVSLDVGERLGDGIDVRLLGALRNGRLAVFSGKAVFNPGTGLIPRYIDYYYWQAPQVNLFQPALSVVDLTSSAITPAGIRFTRSHATATVSELSGQTGVGAGDRVLLAGNFTHIASVPRQGLARLLSSGELDPSFVPEMPLGAYASSIVSVATDGSILLNCSGLGAIDSNKLYRMETMAAVLAGDGSRKSVLSLERSLDAMQISTHYMDAAGRILVSYFSPDASKESNFHLGWLSSDGKLLQTLPTSFQGLSPAVSMTLPAITAATSNAGASYYDPVARASVLENGAILLSGAFSSIDGKPCPGFARLTADGRLDDAFKADSIRNRNWELKGLDSKGRVLAHSKEYPSDNFTRSLRRLLADGSVDRSFPSVAYFYTTIYDADGYPDRGFPTTYADEKGTSYTIYGSSRVLAGRLNAFTSAPFARWQRSSVPQLSIYSNTTSVAAGNDLVLETKTSLTDIISYQWSHDGKHLPGQTGPILDLHPVKIEDEGIYKLTVKRTDLSTLSAELAITVIPSTARIEGYSSRGVVLPGSELITGIGFSGAGEGHVLTRSVGLGFYQIHLNMGGVMLREGNLTCYRHVAGPLGGIEKIGFDEGHVTRPEINAICSRLGLMQAVYFGPILYPSFNAGSALDLQLGSGTYSFVSRGVGNASGVCFVEVYTYDFTGATPGSFHACSTRGRTGTAGNVLIGGFSIRGNSRLRLLIRGMGPSLASHGVANSIADPQIELLRSRDSLENAWINNDWAGDAEIAAVMRKLELSDWDPKSKESAMLGRFDPGSYTVLLRNQGSTGQEGMIEIYVVSD